MSGLVLVGLLADNAWAGAANLRIALLESAPPPPFNEGAELDLRVSALAPAARAILTRLGVWQKLPAGRVSP